MDPSRLMSCRWVLTWKDPDSKDDIDPENFAAVDPTVLKAVGAKRDGWAEREAEDKSMKKRSNMPDGRTAKARLVLRGFQDPDIGSFSTMAPPICNVTCTHISGA